MSYEKLSLRINIKLPSLNYLFQVSHFERHKIKHETQFAFSCALRAVAENSSTLTTFARNMCWTAADTLDLYRMTGHKTSSSNASKRKSKPRRKNAQS